MADDKRPIIIKKRKVVAGGHHGGAWKVAYADFVTAMMAFFLVMWLVTAVSKEQRAAIFEYFKNPSMEAGASAKAAPGQAGPGGASTSPIDMGGGLDAPLSATSGEDGLGTPEGISDEQAKQLADAVEKKQLEALMQDLREAIDKSQALQPFKDQLLLDISPEGLRIQVVDKQNRPMFDIGKTALKDYTVEILREVAKYLNTVPNRVSLSGHTDDKAYPGTGSYSNWELSADRANAARRALLSGGLEPAKISRVVGLASSVLFDREHPYNPINRRISIIVMTKDAEAQALSTDAPDVDAARQRIEAGTANTLVPAEGEPAPGVDTPAGAGAAATSAELAAGTPAQPGSLAARQAAAAAEAVLKAVPATGAGAGQP